MRTGCLAIVVASVFALPASAGAVSPDPAPARAPDPAPAPAPAPVVPTAPAPVAPPAPVQTQRAPAATPRPPVPAQAPAPRVRHHHHKRAAHRRTNATVDHIPDILQPAAAHTNESPAVALLLASLALLLAAAAAASLLRLSAAAAAAIGLALALGAQPAAATTIKWTPYGTAGEDGWYVSDVYVNWIVSDYTPPITDDNCPRTVHLTSDTRGTQVSCSITTSQDGQSSLTTPPIKIDTTPPAGVAAAAARPADANGWYRRPVDIAWSGTDATSGIASCTTLTYAGPDGANTPVAGGCRDLAGNSATGGFSLDYDATAPTVARLTATPENRRVKLAWTPSADTVSVEVMRSPGLSGGRSSEVYSGVLPAFSDSRVRNGVAYRYVVRARDAAGNVATRTARVTPSGLTPAAGKRLLRPPTLRWPKSRKARYYNVQLVRGGLKVLSIWPTAAKLRLHRRWVFRGHRQRLLRGHYRWYVWPGYGSRSAHRYGPLIGRSAFTVVR